MSKQSSQKDLLDRLSNYIAQNKGLPVFAGVLLIVISLVIHSVPQWSSYTGPLGWLAQSDLLLHVGIIVGLLGLLVGDAL